VSINNDSPKGVFPRASFLRRVGGWVYDVLLAISVYMLAGVISSIIFHLLVSNGLISQEGYLHEIDVLLNTPWLMWLNELWKLSWVAFFFVYFWSKSGQTLGMRAWRLRVQNQDGSLLTQKTALKRLLFTLLGLGNLWVLFDRKQRLSLQDKLTNTEVVCLSLAENKGKNWVN
jgi:uncharacterized RDD family membrane protein YckC